MPYQKRIFSGIANKPLAEEICRGLSTELSPACVKRFGDDEPDGQLLDNVRGKDVFIINSIVAPAENILDTVFLAKAAKLSSAGRVTLVIPYLGFNRADRKDRPRISVAAKTIIDILKLSLADRALLLDLHSEPTAPHFEPMVTDHLYASRQAIPFLKERLTRPFVVAAPDKGGGPRARKYAAHLGLPRQSLVFFDKDRPQAGEVDEESVVIIGDVKGKDVLFVDDMIDSGGTLIANAKAAKEAGANRIYAFATHGLFSKNALERIGKSDFTGVFVTNTLHHDPERLKKEAKDKVEICSIAPLLAEAISRIHENESLSPLILD